MIFFVIIIFLFKNINCFDLKIYTNEAFLIFDKKTSILKYYTYDSNIAQFKISFESFFSYGTSLGDKTKEGDFKTPEGVYFTLEKISRYELPKFFGAGALKLNYPNPVDIKLKKTGSNIWIHGTDDSSKLELNNITRGCITINNQDFIKISSLVKINKTPIIITNDLNKTKFSYSKNFKIKVKDKLDYTIFKEKDKIRYKYE